MLRPQVNSLNLRGSQLTPYALAGARVLNPQLDQLLGFPAEDLDPQLQQKVCRVVACHVMLCHVMSWVVLLQYRF